MQCAETHMNDPALSDPSLPAVDDGPIEEDFPPHSEEASSQTNGNWFNRLTQSWISRLTNTSLRSQMEGALADDSGSDQTFSTEEKAMLRNILALREMRVDDVMIPRADIDAVEDDISLGTLLAIYQDVGHSRLPVYRETLDDPVGMVHIKDMVGLMTQEANITLPEEDNAIDSMEGAPRTSDSDDTKALANHLRSLDNIDLDRPLKDLGVIRDILFVPPSMPAVDLMATMRAARTQMALVIDEYGGTDGLISLEDVVETVVGDIEDEHDDEDEVFIASAGPNLFIADAKADLEDVVETIGTPLPLDDESLEDVVTLGGFIFTHIGRIPVRGELIAVTDGLEFEIMEADRRRIRRVKIRIKPTKKPLKRPLELSGDPQKDAKTSIPPSASEAS
ncbi:hypothetical protein C0081_14750 [Cohaesibacter celericrescens]|uniref:CBS domain-containing protein n=2 Tax=Cohaesibacter celericrescens TaxID=2067669 RepID=A0A2N5XP16_9HYPH|nr:hypothetical protein C0081_14750 [Cohaesibacter celericrescens]